VHTISEDSPSSSPWGPSWRRTSSVAPGGD
jgi:hypothetical protein